MKAEDAQGTPTQRHVSPSILEYEDKDGRGVQGLDSIVSFKDLIVDCWQTVALASYLPLCGGAFGDLPSL